MISGNTREVDIPLSFLGNKTAKATLYMDGADADTEATSTRITTCKISRTDTLHVTVARNGGFVAVLK